MLELRPTCEQCNTALAANSVEAMICSFECTFCRTCVDTVLHNVCPNCGGGFCPRPARPARAWREGASLASHPAGARVAYKPVATAAHQEFAQAITSIAPHER